MRRNVDSKSSKDKCTSTIQPLHQQDHGAFFMVSKDTQLVSPLGEVFFHFRIALHFLQVLVGKMEALMWYPVGP